MNPFRPRMAVRSIYDIPLSFLETNGIDSLILDVDNTLVPWNEPEPSIQLVRFIRTAQTRKMRVLLLSNNRKARVEDFARKLGTGVLTMAKAGKPKRGAFVKAAEMLRVPKGNCCVVGDQLFTDIMGGNRAGMYTILVNPIDLSVEFIGTRINRRIETLVMKIFKIRRA